VGDPGVLLRQSQPAHNSNLGTRVGAPDRPRRPAGAYRARRITRTMRHRRPLPLPLPNRNSSLFWPSLKQYSISNPFFTDAPRRCHQIIKLGRRPMSRWPPLELGSIRVVPASTLSQSAQGCCMKPQPGMTEREHHAWGRCSNTLKPTLLHTATTAIPETRRLAEIRSSLEGDPRTARSTHWECGWVMAENSVGRANYQVWVNALTQSLTSWRLSRRRLRDLQGLVVLHLWKMAHPSGR